MNVLFAFWGFENPCKHVVATDYVGVALYNGPRIFIIHISFPFIASGIVILDLITLLVNFGECFGKL